MSLSEGIGHTAAEDELINLAEQVLNDTDLGRDLRTTHDGNERTLDVAEYIVNSLNLLLHQQTQHLVVSVEVVGDNSGRSVLAVSSTEGIHDVAVSVRSERLGKLLLAGLHSLLSLVVSRIFLIDANGLTLFLRIETQVLEQQSLTHLQSLSSISSLSAVGSESNGNTQSLLYSLTDLTQRLLGVNLSFGLTHVRHDDDSTTISQNLLQGGQSTADTGVVSNLTILVQGYVEVYTYDCLLTGKVEFVNCHNVFVLLKKFEFQN